MANVYVSHVLRILYSQIQFISHMDNNTKLYPQQMNITLQNWTKQLTEHHNKWTKQLTEQRIAE